MSFYQLTPEALEAINQLDLTYSQYKLYLYCLSRNPYEDSWVEFQATDIMRICHFKSASSVYQGFKKLRELGLVSTIWESGRFSTTGSPPRSKIATAIRGSLRRSKYRHRDLKIATAIQKSLELTDGAISETERDKEFKRDKEASRSENFSNAPDPGSPDYWKRLYDQS